MPCYPSSTRSQHTLSIPSQQPLSRYTLSPHFLPPRCAVGGGCHVILAQYPLNTPYQYPLNNPSLVTPYHHILYHHDVQWGVDAMLS